jgi:hypothetical protein
VERFEDINDDAHFHAIRDADAPVSRARLAPGQIISISPS